MVKFNSEKTYLLLLSLFLIALAACSPAESTDQPPEPVALTLIATDIAYDAQRVEAVAGQPLRLTLDNQGVLEHDFSIMEVPLAGAVTMTEHSGEMASHDMSHMDEEPAVHVAAPTGGHSTIEFIPSTPGEYAYYCTVPGHREAGMEGVLVVK